MIMGKESGVAIIKGLNKYQDHFIFGLKKQNRGKEIDGMWHLPGETIEEGETAIDAIVRGGIEELEINVKVGKNIVNELTPDGTYAHWYECTTEDYILKPGSDLDGAIWIRKDVVEQFLKKEYINLIPEAIKKYLGITSSK